MIRYWTSCIACGFLVDIVIEVTTTRSLLDWSPMSSIPSRAFSRPSRTHLTALAGAAALLVLSACGSGGNSAGSSASASGSSTAAGSCGSVPSHAPQDPQNVLASLPKDVAAAYNGYTAPVLPSAWAKWKPSHPAPYKVAILSDPPINAFQTTLFKSVEATLAKSGDIQVVANVTPQAQNDVPGDLQLFNQLVSGKPDLIIAEPLAPAPFVGAVEAAAKAGIPVVTAWEPVPTPSSIGVGVNNWLQAATLAAKVVKKMGGKGTVLEVHGIPGVQQDADAFAGFKAVLAQCPDIKVAGEVTGNYNPAATKGATLQFLSSHPAQIGGVLQAGVMTTGIIQAFQQLGRPVPEIADLGSTQGGLAFAHDNKSSYSEFGTSTPDAAIGQAVANVAIRTLHGEGPVLNQMITEPKYITADNIDSVYQSGWTLSSPGDAALPGDTFMTEKQLAAFFGTKQ
jgi:ribose transport system substrate-binding protein